MSWEAILLVSGFDDSVFTRLKALLFPSSTAGAMFIPGHPSMVSANSVGATVQTLIDFSGNSKNATQGTPASRGIYGRVPKSGRRNILTQTATLSTQTKTTTAAQHTLSFYGTGTVTLSGTSTAGPLVGTGVSDVVSLTFTPSDGPLTLTVSGSATSAQLELGASRTGYQLVSDAGGYDIIEAGQANCYYIQADGIDDGYETTSIDYSGTDKISAIASFRRLSSAAEGMLVELSSNSNSATSGNAAFSWQVPQGVNTVTQFAHKGSLYSLGSFVDSAVPNTGVYTTGSDLSLSTNEVEQIRKNGVGQVMNRPINGNNSGNFGNYPLYLFRRGGTTLPFSGQLFFGAFAGLKLTLEQRALAESLVSKLTPEVSL